MTYWLLTTEYPPFHGGGISTYNFFTAQMLHRKGHSVTVFVADSNVSGQQRETAPEVTIVRFNINCVPAPRSLGYTARLSYAFAHIVKDEIVRCGKPDIIEAQDYLGIAYYLQQGKFTGWPELQKVPILLTLHSPAFLYLDYNRVPTYKFPDFWTGEMEKQAIAAADGLISPTAFLPQALQPYINLTEKQIHIVPNPYQHNPEHRPTAYNRNQVVFYGKLSPQKGVLKLLEYFADLWEKGHTCCLELIGEPNILYHPEWQTMGQFLEKKYGTYLHKNLLKIRGKISTSAITEALEKAHVVVAPSIVDNLPYAIMEAMSRGKVVLTSMQGGQREIINHAVDGFLFDHDKEGDFAEKLLQILQLSNAELDAIGSQAAKTVAATYNPETVYHQKMQALAAIMALPARCGFPFLHQQAYGRLTEEENTLLTVVIPYFNMGHYIEACLQSVLQSTYTPLHVLIVNDGSTDAHSLAVLKKIESAQVTILHTKNKGVAHARNFGAHHARGRFLAFLDADDKVSPQYYRKAIQVLTTHTNVFFVGAWVQYFENSRAVWPTFTPQPPYALVHNPVNSSSLVYKKAAFLTAGLNDAQVDYGLEDYESVLALLHKGYNGVVLPECLFYYRVRKGSMIRAINQNKLLHCYKYITDKHAHYYIKFAAQVIHLLNANGPGFGFDNPTLKQHSRWNQRIISPVFDKVKNLIAEHPTLKRLVLKLIRNRP